MAAATAPPRGVLLDLDDVLIPWNTPSHWQWAWRPLGPRLGDRHTRSAIRRQLRGWDRRRWRGLIGAEPPVDPEARRSHLRATLHAIAGHVLGAEETEAVVARFDRPAGEIETYDDVGPALRRLREAGVPVAAVTDLPEPVARWILRRAGLSDVLLAVHGEEPAEVRLPGRAGFRKACEAIERKASQTVYVGDLFWSDVRAAARAGVTAYLLDRYDRFGTVDARRVATLAGVVELPVGPEDPASTSL